YLLLGVAVWFLFLNSGIHPTIAGVLVAFCVPAKPVYAPVKYIQKIRTAIGHFHCEDDEELNKKSILSAEQMNWLKEVESSSDKVISPLQELEDSLHPLVNYFIVPLFAFANAGIFLLDMDPSSVFEGVSLAIICGLFFGKFLGIFSFSWLCIKLKLASMPARSDWNSFAAVSMLGGIGFTVSLFIATLSFGSPAQIEMLNHAKLGIVIGSLLSGVLGFIWLHYTLPHKSAVQESEI
ncbi:MAG: Na+/H+ antiporter NhaA, partial [Muribaculaceae bacterium]|nr:Na+/H+ antiporter NhaA [Muribaculaceae bacterium]